VDVVHERCAGIDISKTDVKVCIRVPGPGRRRHSEVRTFSTMTADLLAMRDWLLDQRVTVVGMEATGAYWKPVFYVLEHDLDCWLLNAFHMKAVPGRKTDVKDAQWIAELVEHGLVRPSFVPPEPIRQLRDLTRYRTEIIRERTRELQRLEKLLEDAGVKLSVVVSDLGGKSARAMLAALVAGERDPDVLAELALAKMRGKRPLLAQALTGRFNAHHAFLVQVMLERIDACTDAEARLSAQIDAQIAPFRRQLELITTIPGVGRRSAEVIVAETGADMTRFASAAHLASWAGMCPGNNQSGAKTRTAPTRHGDPWLKGALGQVAIAASRTKGTYLAARYRRVASRRGNKRALVALGHTILITVWTMLNTDLGYRDLGGDYFTQRLNPQAKARQARRLVTQLRVLGYHIELPAMAT
jgi:transposase